MTERLVVHQTRHFAKWFADLRDRRTKFRIADRLVRLSEGHFGDSKSVGNGINELRFAFGPGYRLYYTRIGSTVVVILCAGDKSTQARDITRASQILSEGE